MRPDREEKRKRRLAEWQLGPASPCISVCQMDPATQLCIGCFRTIDEIREWSISGPQEKENILERVRARKENKKLAVSE